MDENEENLFSKEDVEKIINDTIEEVLDECDYDKSKLDIWINLIANTILAGLAKLDKKFKYMVQCIITQKIGNGLHTASSCYVNTATDGSSTVQFENKTLVCLVTVKLTQFFLHFIF